jgi:hypothetical protein
MPLVSDIEHKFHAADFDLMRLKVANESNAFSESYRKNFVPEINYLPSEQDAAPALRSSVREVLNIFF